MATSKPSGAKALSASSAGIPSILCLSVWDNSPSLQTPMLCGLLAIPNGEASCASKEENYVARKPHKLTFSSTGVKERQWPESGCWEDPNHSTPGQQIHYDATMQGLLHLHDPSWRPAASDSVSRRNRFNSQVLSMQPGRWSCLLSIYVGPDNF